jgi:hypothetical protein
VRVTDAAGHPLQGVTIAVEGAGVQLTDSNGQYSVEAIRAGRHTISLSSVVHESVEDTLNLVAGENRRVRYWMRPTPEYSGASIRLLPNGIAYVSRGRRTVRVPPLPTPYKVTRVIRCSPLR